jgi:ATP-dependent Clp protease ATP-binding subunit ClpC
MQGYNFTERVRKVLAMASEEAARLNHEYVGTEHMLLGLIREGDGVAVAVLRSLQVDLAEVRRTIEGLVKRGKTGPPVRRDLPYTSRAKKVLELAMAEARGLNHAYVGTEHLLLGLLAEEKGIAAQVLSSLGVRLGTARSEAINLLGGPRTKADVGEVGRLQPIGFRLHVQYEGGYWYEGTFDGAEDVIAFLQRLPSS